MQAIATALALLCVVLGVSLVFVVGVTVYRPALANRLPIGIPQNLFSHFLMITASAAIIASGLSVLLGR